MIVSIFLFNVFPSLSLGLDGDPPTPSVGCIQSLTSELELPEEAYKVDECFLSPLEDYGNTKRTKLSKRVSLVLVGILCSIELSIWFQDKLL